MTVNEFLQRQRAQNPVAAVGFLMDLLTLLDEYGEERCSVLSGKIRARLNDNEAESS